MYPFVGDAVASLSKQKARLRVEDGTRFEFPGALTMNGCIGMLPRMSVLQGTSYTRLEFLCSAPVSQVHRSGDFDIVYFKQRCSIYLNSERTSATCLLSRMRTSVLDLRYTSCFHLFRVPFLRYCPRYHFWIGS